MSKYIILRDIAFANATDGWMVSTDSIYATNDGGISWTIQTVNDQVSQTTYKVLAVPTDSTAYVGGRSKRNSSAISYADAFSKALSPTSAFDFLSSSVSNFKTNDLDIYSMAFSTPNIGFAGGARGTIYKLEFQGATNFGPWEINLDLSPTNGPQIIPSIVFPTAADGMFLTASPEADINSLIYHTADAGNTWDMTPDTIPGLLHTSLHAPDASTAWVVGYNGKIYKGVLSTVGIKESELTISTRVFPNPTTDIVKVELNGEAIGELNYTLLDVAGRQILSNTVEKQNVSQHFELDLGRLATGIYVLQISNLAGQNYSTRIVKQ